MEMEGLTVLIRRGGLEWLFLHDCTRVWSLTNWRRSPTMVGITALEDSRKEATRGSSNNCWSKVTRFLHQFFWA